MFGCCSDWLERALNTLIYNEDRAKVKLRLNTGKLALAPDPTRGALWQLSCPLACHAKRFRPRCQGQPGSQPTAHEGPPGDKNSKQKPHPRQTQIREGARRRIRRRDWGQSPDFRSGHTPSQTPPSPAAACNGGAGGSARSNRWGCGSSWRAYPTSPRP